MEIISISESRSPTSQKFSRRLQSRSSGFIALLSTVIFAFPLPAQSASVDTGQGNRVTVPLTSLKDLRDQNVVKQTYDYSCGAAALATLLTYGLSDKVTELDVLLSVLTLLSKDEEAVRKKKGLSLLDLQNVAQTRGYKAQGFRLTAEYLPKLKGPVIVFIKPRGYEHFAVLKGIRGDRVYLADPSLGNMRMP